MPTYAVMIGAKIIGTYRGRRSKKKAYEIVGKYYASMKNVKVAKVKGG